jgi:hypothetical protein
MSCDLISCAFASGDYCFDYVPYPWEVVHTLDSFKYLVHSLVSMCKEVVLLAHKVYLIIGWYIDLPLAHN